MSSESLEVLKLFERIASFQTSPIEFNGVAFRSVKMNRANKKDLLSGSGAGRFGGRWNPRNTDAVYASLSPETAVKESYQNFAKYKFKKSFVKPRVLIAIEVDIHFLLDLTDAKTRRGIDFSLNELIKEDWHSIQDAGEESWTQAIGRGCYVAEFEGLIVPSAVDRKGKNIVIFPDKVRKDSSFSIIGEEELPPE